MSTGEAGSTAAEVLAAENRRLRRAVEEMSVLNELAVEVSRATSAEAVIETLIRRSLKAVDAEQGVITLIEGRTDDPLKTYVREQASSAEAPPFHFTQILLGWILKHKKPLRLDDPASDARFPGVTWDGSLRSLLAVPMLVKGKPRAVLTVYNKRHGDRFDDEDQRLLAIIASQSAQVLENARLAEQERELVRIEGELALAGRIQEQLLPAAPPVIAGYQVAGASLPAKQVGGDYFDFIPEEGGAWVICLGDVSGKGLPASLLMANLQATIRSLVDPGRSLAASLGQANRLLHRNTGSAKFVTFCLLRLDPRAHRVIVANAGHNPPLRLSPGRAPQRIEPGGPVLGVLPDATFEEESFDLEPGELLVLYSDGITEALDALGGELGEGWLVSELRALRERPAGELVQALFTAVRRATDEAPQHDDMTLVLIRRVEA